MKRHPAVATFHGHTFIPRLLSRSSVVVDLGGNLGEFSSGMAASFGCTCYIVEPMPELFARIPEGPRLHKFNVAVASRNQTLTFHTSGDITAGSLTRRDGVAQHEIQVEGIMLDDFIKRHNIQRVDLLKVDIEGTERELFASLSESTLRSVRQITIEFHDFIPEVMGREDVAIIHERLKKAGFRCLPWKMRSNMDTLFVRRELMSLPSYLWVKYVLRPVSKAASRLPLQRLGSRRPA
jgi:FkbM family methyltransferase